MHFLVLLGDDESNATTPGTPEWDAEMAGYMHFDEVAGDAILAGEALEPTATATTVRHGDAGAPLVTSGPYAETTEALGGLYILDVGTLDDAIELVRHLPAAATGWVAVRPIALWQGPEGDAPPAAERYLALMYGKESPADVPETPEWDAGAGEHGRFVESAGDGVVSGAALHPIDTTTTVRVREGELLVTDGPFSESAEVIGGYYLLRAPSKEAVIALAATVPVNPGGAVEVRPVMDVGEG